MDNNNDNNIDRGRAALMAWERSRPENYFDDDGNLHRVLRMHLGDPVDRHWAMLQRAGAMAAGEMDALARETNRDENLPELQRFGPMGTATEEVVFHPGYHELAARVWSSGVLSVLGEPGNNLLSGAISYLLDHNGEMGHICPVACTAGCIKLIQTVGSDQQKERYLPRLLETDSSKRLHASQFVTEVQGGSDVGANACWAEHDEASGQYRIFGEKWFCSVADASLFVVSARIPDGGEGTRGLGLFLVPRMVQGRPNGFALRRLKTKLGTRSMATGEIDFLGALAEPLGDLSRGFRNLVGIVLDTSRVHNAVAAAGMMHRVVLDAQTYMQHREAFGQPILRFPAMQELLAHMKVSTLASMATTFRILAMSDALERGEGDDDLRAARRIHVMINKYWTAVRGTEVVRQGIETLGGNGTIEEFSVLPRFYRDAIVLESWEGSHNTLCAQVLRDFATRGLSRPWLEELAATLQKRVTHPSLEEHRERASALLDEVRGRIEVLLGGDAEQGSLYIRHVVERMATLSAYVALLAELDWERHNDQESHKAQAVTFFRLHDVDRLDPMDVPGYGELVRTLATLP